MTRAVMIAIVCSYFAASCASLPTDRSKWSPEQIKADAQDRSAVVECTQVNTPWGPQRQVKIALDRQTVPSGVLSANADCVVSIQADPAAAKAAASAFSAPASAGPTLHNCYKSGPPPGVMVCEVK